MNRIKKFYHRWFVSGFDKWISNSPGRVKSDSNWRDNYSQTYFLSRNIYPQRNQLKYIWIEAKKVYYEKRFVQNDNDKEVDLSGGDNGLLFSLPGGFFTGTIFSNPRNRDEGSADPTCANQYCDQWTRANSSGYDTNRLSNIFSGSRR